MRELPSILDRFFSGDCTEKEKALVARLIEEGEDGLFDNYCREIWKTVDSDEIPHEVIQKIKTGLMSKIEADSVRRQRSLRFRNFLRAAIAAAALLIAVLIGWRLDHNRPSEMFEVVAQRGQKSSITLPDGSQVMLNSASSISYSSDYNVTNRDVYLWGEAYFDVADNQNIPFIVHTQEMSVRALGTKFNVKAYSDEDFVVATLVEGSILADANGHGYTLSPYQEVMYDRTAGTASLYPVPECQHAIPWIRDEILFDNDSLQEVAVILERMYNVNIVFDDDHIKGFTYTGLVRNNSLQNVLDLISGTSPVDYVIKDGSIRFMSK